MCSRFPVGGRAALEGVRATNTENPNNRGHARQMIHFPSLTCLCSCSRSNFTTTLLRMSSYSGQQMYGPPKTPCARIPLACTASDSTLLLPLPTTSGPHGWADLTY
ncbi:hypothetical protein TRVL_07836 [Trypanosoma vivax]|nr:hypothetical protein TRVL_07836 [Trypanosoma vivax]